MPPLLIREPDLKVRGFYERLGYAVIPRITMKEVLDDSLRPK